MAFRGKHLLKPKLVPKRNILGTWDVELHEYNRSPRKIASFTTKERAKEFIRRYRP